MSEKMSDMGVTHALARAEHGDERDRVAACKALATHISTLQREADGLREALEQISLFAGPTLPRYENAVNIIRDIQYVARAALNGSPQATATEGSDL